jgi:hypothetical protein
MNNAIDLMDIYGNRTSWAIDQSTKKANHMVSLFC